MTGPDVRRMIEGLDLPQRQLAMLLDVSYTTVKRWLTGEARVPLSAWLVLLAMQEGRISRSWIEAHRAMMGIDPSP